MRQEKMMFDFEMDLENACWAGDASAVGWDGQYKLFPEPPPLFSSRVIYLDLSNDKPVDFNFLSFKINYE